MKRLVVLKILALALSLSVAACSKNEGANNAATPAAKIAQPAKTESVAAPATATTAETDKPPVETTPTEAVNETEDTPDPTEEPANKNAAPLKLAQLPPRVAQNSKFKEGVNYQRLSPTQPVDVPPDQVQVLEIFWYGCPHCNAIDPRLEAWRKAGEPNGKAAYFAFSRIPAAWNDITRFHGRLYYALEALGKVDELHALVFREIHENGNPLNTIDKARQFLTAHGIAPNDFQKAFGALSIERKLDDANLLAQRYRATGVPHFVVNGKYITDVAMAGGEEQLIQVLNELAAREHSKD